MDLTYQYCPERYRLELCNCNLVTALFSRTQRLITLIGKDHTEFMATKASCAETRQQIVEVRDLVRAHRAEHGC